MSIQTQQLVPLPTPTTPTNNSNEPMSDNWPTVMPNQAAAAVAAAATTLDKNRNGGDLSHMSSADQSPADRPHHHHHDNYSQTNSYQHEYSRQNMGTTGKRPETDPYEYLPTPPTTPLDSPDGSGSLTPKLPAPATATYSATSFNSTAEMAVETNNLASTSTSTRMKKGTRMVGEEQVYSNSVDRMELPAPAPLTIFSLPNETLDRIFSFIPRDSLPTVMRAHSRCHVLAERLLYYKIQHLGLYGEEERFDDDDNNDNVEVVVEDQDDCGNRGEGSEHYGSFGNGDSARRRSVNGVSTLGGGLLGGPGGDDDDWRGGGATTTAPRSRPTRNKHWQCLRTLASRRSAAQAVRHFAIKGLPWIAQEPSALSLLSRVLSSLENLCSLQLDLGTSFERALLLSNPTFSFSSLSAINVCDPRTAAYLCNPPAANGQGAQLLTTTCSRVNSHTVSRPITTLRIDYDSPLDAEMVASLLTALTANHNHTTNSSSHSSPTTRPPVQRLQLAVSCESVAGFVRILDMIANSLPFLVTLGIYIRSPRPIVAERSQVSVYSVIFPTHFFLLSIPSNKNIIVDALLILIRTRLGRLQRPLPHSLYCKPFRSPLYTRP
jgi:hypothetical protein